MTWTPADFAQEIGSFRRELRGLVRRMVVNLTDAGVWRVLGHALISPTDREGRDVENYPGIGFAARPPAGLGEAIVIQVGGANNPAIVASRDEATRANVADLIADEAVMYNSTVRVHMKADGTVEIGTHGGTMKRLAFLEDVQAVRDDLHEHEHSYVGGGTGSGTLVTTGGPSVTAPVGTSKLKAE